MFPRAWKERNTIGITWRSHRGTLCKKWNFTKVLHEGIWWLGLFQYVDQYCKVCDVCQRTWKPSFHDEMLLYPMITLEPFDKWVVDYVGPINPTMQHTGACYIIIVIYYLTWWVEAMLVNDYTIYMTTNFLFENVLSCFGCPKLLISDQGMHFLNSTIHLLTKEFIIHHQQSTSYHP